MSWALWTAESLGRTADLEGGHGLLRFLLRTFLLYFCNYYFLKVRPPHLPLSLFTMGLLHPAPGASDTVWLPWKPPRKGKSNLMPVTTWRLLIHLLAAPGENSQGRTCVGIPPGPQGPFPELAGLPLASINPWKNSINTVWERQALPPKMKQG